MRESVDPGLARSVGLTSTGRPGVDAVALSVIAAAILAQREGKDVSFSLNRNFYPGLARYGGKDFTYANVRRGVDHAAGLGLISTTMGKWRSNGTGRQSTFSATPALLELAGAAPRVLLRPGECIRLKDSEKRLINYADTAATRTLRRDTREWSESIAGSDVRLDAPDVEWVTEGAVSIPLATEGGGPITIATGAFELYRVFNDSSFKQGGRIYGHWCQSLSDHRRAQITIDAEPVALLDYGASHPRMLYARAGVPLDGDPYPIAGIDRDTAKVALMVVLNAASRRQGIEAMAYKFAVAEQKEATGSAVSRKKALVTPRHRKAAQSLLLALESRHAPIASTFYRGTGLACQRIEADILADVARTARREGIVTLPVHDELITPDRHAGRVRELMTSCWTKRIGTEPVIK